jgi:outer membrane protein assembly factor BamD (BamD/ComL family)
LEQLNKKKIFKDADFWYHKGISSAKKGNTETAIECYKQALKLVRYTKTLILFVELKTLSVTVQSFLLL